MKTPASPFAKELPGTLELKLGSTLDFSQEGLVLLNSEGQISDINTPARRFLNWMSADVSERDFWDVVSTNVAEAHQVATVHAIDHLEQHSFIVHREFEGDWLEYTFRPYPGGCVVNLKDVTSVQSLQLALAESESTNQLLFGENPNAMWVFDLVSQRVLAVNQAAIDFYGISKNVFLALRLGALFPDGTGAALFSSVSNAGAARVVLQICRQVKSDGTVMLVELACSHITWQNHQAMLVSLADVTERHLSDRAMRRENTELKASLVSQSNALKNACCDIAAVNYALSHDLQVPLHAANGFATILAEKYGTLLDDGGRHYISRIQASTQFMAQMVDDLRTLVQLPQVSGKLEKLDVVSLCAPIIDKLRAHHLGRAVTFEVESGSFFHADKRLLVIALNCLLENAWKFTSKRPDGWIKVAVISGKANDEHVLQVSDNGEGFDSAYSDKLFKAFQRLHSSADYPGNGLGLVTVKRVAERHNGRVWAASTPTGASFSMAWPRVWATDVNRPRQ